MADPKPLFGLASETWVKWLVTGVATLMVISVAWSFRVENRLGHFLDADRVRSEVKEVSQEIRADMKALRRRIEGLERGATKQEQMLSNIQSGIEEIKQDLRRMRRGTRRTK